MCRWDVQMTNNIVCHSSVAIHSLVTEFRNLWSSSWTWRGIGFESNGGDSLFLSLECFKEFKYLHSYMLYTQVVFVTVWVQWALF